jgi:hypothetical protein
MTIRIILTIDEERLQESGAVEQTDEQVRSLLAMMRGTGRLSIQAPGFWLPVTDLRVRSS